MVATDLLLLDDAVAVNTGRLLAPLERIDSHIVPKLFGRRMRSEDDLLTAA